MLDFIVSQFPHFYMPSLLLREFAKFAFVFMYVFLFAFVNRNFFPAI